MPGSAANSTDSDTTVAGLMPHPAAPAAIAYVCADINPANEALYQAWCTQRADADGWPLTEVVTDPDDLTPLIERPGWQRVTKLITDGGICAVITVNRSMVAENPAGWTRLASLLNGLGVVLVTAASTPNHAARIGGAS